MYVYIFFCIAYMYYIYLCRGKIILPFYLNECTFPQEMYRCEHEFLRLIDQFALNAEHTSLTSPASPVMAPMVPIFSMAPTKSCAKLEEAAPR